ncbi:TA system VapC family ribonuclease toxin [Rhodoferax sp.]|uniref:TA system VapC family ribonuclease toxin n=1 Tax=Rhodoferax sp. TaxID=50421 RepID=UPI0027544621|nr:PIN domain-containing protein [Rhodoferax sp.]
MSKPARAPYTDPAPVRPVRAREAPGLLWPLRPIAPTGDLPDINVWLALAVQEHPHHAAARRYWDDAHAQPSLAPGAATLWFCRITMLGLVRLLCQPKAVGAGALQLDAAWALYQQYRSLPQIGLASEPLDCDTQLGALLAKQTLPARLWTDAYLAALAQSSGLRLVTFDRDFDRFGLDGILILPRP